MTGLTEHPHEVYIDPKHPNKRTLHYHRYVGLMLMYLFSPVCNSLRMVKRATEFRKVQKSFGITRFGRTTISEAGQIFDPELAKGVIGRLADKIPDSPLSTTGRDDLDQIITLVDGSWLPGLASMLRANFRHDGKQRAAA